MKCEYQDLPQRLPSGWQANLIGPLVVSTRRRPRRESFRSYIARCGVMSTEIVGGRFATGRGPCCSDDGTLGAHEHVALLQSL